MNNAPTTEQILACKKEIAEFQSPSLAQSLWQLGNTLIPFFCLWVIAYQNLHQSLWIAIAAIVLGGGFLVRAFIIFHDCGHGSFFKSKKANDIVGTLMGLLAFTPYLHWRWEHALHHATAGDLDKRGLGDMWTLTVREYQASTPLQKFLYRAARHPFILFFIAPVLLFSIKQRFTSAQASKELKRSVYLTTLALVCIIGVISYFIGLPSFLIIHGGILAVGAGFGVWLFYFQHQYEGMYWKRHKDWDYFQAALQGSSYYKLPKILQFFSGNIGFHHVHHLNSRIPNYNLEKCHNSVALFKDVRAFTFFESLPAALLGLWDEDQEKLIRFSELPKLAK